MASSGDGETAGVLLETTSEEEGEIFSEEVGDIRGAFVVVEEISGAGASSGEGVEIGRSSKEGEILEILKKSLLRERVGVESIKTRARTRRERCECEVAIFVNHLVVIMILQW